MPPPAPNTVARPTTLGACQVRLQLSMLLLPIDDAGELLGDEVHLVRRLRAAEQPERVRAVPVDARRANPAAARSSASSHVAGRSAPFSRTSGWVSRVSFSAYPITSPRSSKGPENRLRYVHDAIPGPKRQWRTGHFDESGDSTRFLSSCRNQVRKDLILLAGVAAIVAPLLRESRTWHADEGPEVSELLRPRPATLTHLLLDRTAAPLVLPPQRRREAEQMIRVWQERAVHDVPAALLPDPDRLLASRAQPSMQPSASASPPAAAAWP